MTDEIPPGEIVKLYEKLNKEAEAFGYHLNPDVKFAKMLIKGLLVNGGRYAGLL
jgi:ferredoxin-thioredoxin reductase catalytic subunit